MSLGLKLQKLAAPFLACALAASLAGCVSATLADVSPTSSLFGRGEKLEPLQLNLFVASTRPPPGQSAASADGRAHFAMNMISIPPGHKAGQIELPNWGKASPKSHFVVTYERGMGEGEFMSEIASHISGRVGADRDVLVFVHGFNTSYDEARLRLAQIVADGRFGGVPVLFTWASASQFLAYEGDKQSATIARDAFVELLANLGKTPGVGRVHVLAHSMGGWLAMETLRQNAIAGNPTLNGRLGEVMLAAPDIDIAVFRQQMARLQGARISVFATPDDRALNLSSRLAGLRPRLGAIDPAKSADRAELQRMGVRIYDLSQFSGGFIRHGVYADAPSVIRTIGAELTRVPEAERNRAAIIDAGVTRSEPAPQSQPAPAPAPAPAQVEASPLPAAPAQ